MKDFRNIIEYTNLRSPSKNEIQTFVERANFENYYGVCMDYSSIGIAAKYRKPGLKLITVAGFPPIRYWALFKNMKPNDYRLQFQLGLYTRSRIDDVKRIIDDPNVDELDVVFPMFWYATGHINRIYHFLKGVKDRFKKPVKVITELGTMFKNLINLFEIADLIEQSGCDFFKTNTGLIPTNVNLTMLGIHEVKNMKPNMRF